MKPLSFTLTMGPYTMVSILPINDNDIAAIKQMEMQYRQWASQQAATFASDEQPENPYLAHGATNQPHKHHEEV